MINVIIKMVVVVSAVTIEVVFWKFGVVLVSGKSKVKCTYVMFNVNFEEEN